MNVNNFFIIIVFKVTRQLYKKYFTPSLFLEKKLFFRGGGIDLITNLLQKQ